MSLQAYQRATERAENPRQAEYRLFGEVSRALIAAAELDPLDFGGRMKALDWNRRLWATMADDCAHPDNKLPAELRASIISLSLWVGRHTRLVIHRKEEFAPLIELNRTMMQGLAGQVDPT